MHLAVKEINIMSALHLPPSPPPLFLSPSDLSCENFLSIIGHLRKKIKSLRIEWVKNQFFDNVGGRGKPFLYVLMFIFIFEIYPYYYLMVFSK